MSSRDYSYDSHRSRGRECRRQSLPLIAKSTASTCIKPSTSITLESPAAFPTPTRSSNVGCIRKVPTRRNSYNLPNTKLINCKNGKDSAAKDQSCTSNKNNKALGTQSPSRSSRYSFCSSTTLNITGGSIKECKPIRSSSQPTRKFPNTTLQSCSSDVKPVSISLNKDESKKLVLNGDKQTHSSQNDCITKKPEFVPQHNTVDKCSIDTSPTNENSGNTSLKPSKSAILTSKRNSCCENTLDSPTRSNLPNKITTSFSSGCIPISVANISSSNSSIASSSSTTLQDIHGSLQDSTWAARAASIALSLTRVNPTVPPYNPRRSMSPSPLPPTNSAPHSPQMSFCRTNFSASCYSTPPSPHHMSHHRLSSPNAASTGSIHSGSFGSNPSLVPSYSQQTLSPGHSRPPSPILPRALSPRRHSSPGHSLTTSPNLRPRSTQRNRSQRTPSPRPPLPPSSSNDVTGPPSPAQRSRTRPRVEFGTSIISKMRGR